MWEKKLGDLWEDAAVVQVRQVAVPGSEKLQRGWKKCVFGEAGSACILRRANRPATVWGTQKETSRLT